MHLFTTAEKNQLLTNGQLTLDGHDIDPKPVVKLFLPGSAMTWLLTELNPVDPDIGFGLCDLGMGEPELGYVSMAELADVKNALGLKVERDIAFRATKSLSAYTAEAMKLRRVTV